MFKNLNNLSLFFFVLQVAVHNIGQGKLTLLDHNEEYVVSFPSGFARSILTVPWVELGGKININCPQTNYTAQIEFKCKQFFSSDVNKVFTGFFLSLGVVHKLRLQEEVGR